MLRYRFISGPKPLMGCHLTESKRPLSSIKVKWKRGPVMKDDERITRLARQIGSEVKKDHHLLLKKPEVLELRRQGATEIYAICADFVGSVNRRMTMPILELTPPEFTSEMFRESGPNLFHVNAQGRILQIVIEATREKFSTEKFLIPYILEGEVRAYNQEMLERTQIRSQALFYCIEEKGNRWHYFEWLHGRSGAFVQAQLVSLLERIV